MKKLSHPPGSQQPYHHPFASIFDECLKSFSGDLRTLARRWNGLFHEPKWMTRKHLRGVSLEFFVNSSRENPRKNLQKKPMRTIDRFGKVTVTAPRIHVFFLNLFKPKFIRWKLYANLGEHTKGLAKTEFEMAISLSLKGAFRRGCSPHPWPIRWWGWHCSPVAPNLFGLEQAGLGRDWFNSCFWFP